MSISEGLIKPTINVPININKNIDMSTDKEITYNIDHLHQHNYVTVWAFLSVALLCVTWLVTSNLSCSPLTTRHSSLESQVRTWASDYPADLRDRWAWCYLDSVANWSTDQKLREDVRLKSVQVLTDADREVLSPLDRQIADAVPKQKTELVETYHAIGNGLKVAEWLPPPDGGVRRQESGDRSEPPPDPKPPPPDRRRIFRR